MTFFCQDIFYRTLRFLPCALHREDTNTTLIDAYTDPARQKNRDNSLKPCEYSNRITGRWYFVCSMSYIVCRYRFFVFLLCSTATLDSCFRRNDKSSLAGGYVIAQDSDVGDEGAGSDDPADGFTFVRASQSARFDPAAFFVESLDHRTNSIR